MSIHRTLHKAFKRHLRRQKQQTKESPMPDEEMRNVAVTETFPPPHHAPPMADELRAQLQKHEQAPEPIMQFFAYEHLPLNLQTASKPFCVLANQLVAELPRSAERTVALRKLLESKDAAVRARIAK